MRTRYNVPFLLILTALAWVFGASASAQQIRITQANKVTEGTGGFTGDLDASDNFGRSVARLGDLNGDGVEDLAVGAQWDDDGGFDRGAVYVLFLNADGSVGAQQKISDTEGGFTGPLGNFSDFGEALSAAGDVDGDGVTDLAVGAPGAGAVWILFLNPDGTVRAEQKIAEGVGGFTGPLGNANDSFGEGVAALGDLDGNGVTDLAVGAPLDDDGGGNSAFENRGAVWLLALNTDGTVHAQRKISQTAGGFTGVLDEFDDFGKDVAAIGDVDGNGVTDLAVGSWTDEDGGVQAGAVWIVALRASGTLRGQQKISATEGGFNGDLGAGDVFGYGVGPAGDLDRDGVPDVLVGAPGYEGGGTLTTNTGAVWALFLNRDGTVKAETKLSSATPGFEGRLDPGDWFGTDVTILDDLDGDGAPELAVGAQYDSDVAANGGAAWVLSFGRAAALAPDSPPAVIPAAGEGLEAAASATTAASGGFALSAGSPNPFASSARFTLDLAEGQHVTVAVLDVLGRRVALLHDGPLAAGRHALVFDASALPPGVYVVRATGGGLVAARRVVRQH